MGYHFTTPWCEAGCTPKSAYPRLAEYEAGCRFYHPGSGRWVNRDPAEEDDGRVPIGTHPVRLEIPPGSKVILCHHPSGHHSVLATLPNPSSLPILLSSQTAPSGNPGFENYATRSAFLLADADRGRTLSDVEAR